MSEAEYIKREDALQRMRARIQFLEECGDKYIADALWIYGYTLIEELPGKAWPVGEPSGVEYYKAVADHYRALFEESEKAREALEALLKYINKRLAMPDTENPLKGEPVPEGQEPGWPGGTEERGTGAGRGRCVRVSGPARAGVRPASLYKGRVYGQTEKGAAVPEDAGGGMAGRR